MPSIRTRNATREEQQTPRDIKDDDNGMPTPILLPQLSVIDTSKSRVMGGMCQNKKNKREKH